MGIGIAYCLLLAPIGPIGSYWPKAAPAAGSWAGPARFWLGGGTRVVGGGAWGLGKATYSQAKLPTVRQSYLLSGKATYCQAKLPTLRQSYLLSGKQQSGKHPTAA